MDTKSSRIRLLNFNSLAAIIILFTSWTIYYKLPAYYIFHFILAISIWIRYFPFSRIRIQIFTVFFFLTFRYYYPQTEFSLSSFMLCLLRTVTLSSLFLISEKDLKSIIKNIFLIISYISLFGLIAHVLRLMNIYNFQEIDTLTFEDGRTYNVYFLHVYEVSKYSGIILNSRFCSIFDEPGYLGTISALYLAYDNYILTKRVNLILFVSGLFTLSFAFFAISFIYILVTKIRLNKNLIKILGLGALLFLVFIQIFPDLTEYLMTRFTYEKGYGFQGDSRGGIYEAYVSISIILSQNFLNILFGNGFDSIKFITFTSYITESTIYRLIYQIGIVGVLYLIVAILYFCKRNLNNFIFILLFICSLYQRPQIFELIFFILLAVGLRFDKTDEKLKYSPS